MNDLLGLLALFFLVLMNGYFVAAEFALVSVRRTRIEQLAEEGNVPARATQECSMSTVENEPPRLYAAREPIFPRRVQGKFRNLKWVLMAITLGIYYITPWIRWDRGPGLPDQAVLVDLANLRFFFFWIEIWPHEFYFVAGLLIMAGLGLFLFTSALGRVWCGYACPQTVWTEIFMWIENAIEGSVVVIHVEPGEHAKGRGVPVI